MSIVPLLTRASLLTPALDTDTDGVQGDEQLPICGQCSRARRYCDHVKRPKFRHHRPAAIINDELPEETDSLAALEDPALADLFHHYIKHLAPWYDLSDAQASFAKTVPRESLTRPLLFNAVLAFAAIHLSRTTAPSKRQVAEQFHSRCIQLLIAVQGDDVLAEDGVTLAAICLLRSYEILAEDFDPNRHLSGAYALASVRSQGLGQASLWRAGFFNYLREDITYSLMNRCPLKIDPRHLIIPDISVDDEVQLNVVTLHLARAINNAFGENFSETLSVQALEDLTSWKSSLPNHFTPYFETPPELEGSTFPTIRMLQDCHVAVQQYYLVTEAVLKSKHSRIEEVAAGLEECAIRICGLAFSSDSPSVMVNSYGPISFICKYLKRPSLRIELVRRLHGCRKDTGWPVQRIIDDLKRVWESKASET